MKRSNSLCFLVSIAFSVGPCAARVAGASGQDVNNSRTILICSFLVPQDQDRKFGGVSWDRGRPVRKARETRAVPGGDRPLSRQSVSFPTRAEGKHMPGHLVEGRW